MKLQIELNTAKKIEWILLCVKRKEQEQSWDEYRYPDRITSKSEMQAWNAEIHSGIEF